MADSKQQQNKEKEAEAHLRRLRVAPRKVRMVADLIRDMDPEEAEAQLLMSPKRASEHVLKLLRSAIANAENNHNMNRLRLHIKEIKVDEGPTYKRWIPRAFGRATPIHKKTSHIHIKLGESEEVKESQYIIPKDTKDKDKDSSGSKSKSDDSFDERPDETPNQPKPTASKKNVMDRMFRRKSV